MPTKRSGIFTSSTDSRSTMVLHFLESEDDEPSQNRTLAVLEVDQLQPAPKGVVHIEVRADFDTTGLPQFMAKDLGTGKEVAEIVSHATMKKAAALVRSPNRTDLRSLPRSPVPAKTSSSPALKTLNPQPVQPCPLTHRSRIAHAGNPTASSVTRLSLPQTGENPRSRRVSPGVLRSRLRDSNPRPTHYECVALAN